MAPAKGKRKPAIGGRPAARTFRKTVRMLTLGDSWLADGMGGLWSLTRSLGERGYVCPQDYNLATAAFTLTAIANRAPRAVSLLPDVDLVLIDGGGNDVHQRVPNFFPLPQNPDWATLTQTPPRSTLDDLLVGHGMGVALNPGPVAAFVAHLAQQMARTLDPLSSTDPKAPQVIVVAYDRPIPDGRSAFNPPWLQPAFARLGLDTTKPAELQHAAALMGQLIDGLNAMVANLVATRYPNRNVHAINLTGTLDPATYLQLWHDELHPNETGFGLLADALIKRLPASVPKPVP